MPQEDSIIEQLHIRTTVPRPKIDSRRTKISKEIVVQNYMQPEHQLNGKSQPPKTTRNEFAKETLTSARIDIEHVTKWFYKNGHRFTVLQDVTLAVERSSFVSVVGQSGCGKTTLLNCISGLIRPDQGTIKLEGLSITEPSPYVGYVSQKDTLLPWKTIIDNVALPLRLRGMEVKDSLSRAESYLELTGLSGFEHHRPSELSGGMLKRASLARTLVYEPYTVLMDEPFGNLDAQTKLLMQRELLALWDQGNRTIVFITHDLEEAISLSDIVVVMDSRPGRIKEIVQVKLARPRDPIEVRFEPGFQELHRYLWRALDAS